MPTALSFQATNPDGSTISLKPIEYRADWPHMGHQRLFFRCYGGQGIDERAKIKVTGTNPDMPVFCGWFEGIKRPSNRSLRPQEYRCLGHSAILQYRYPFLRTYTEGDSVAAILGDTPASQGLLFQASSLATPFWSALTYGVPAGTYQLIGPTGTNYPQRIPVPTPDVYLGTTKLTQAASLAGIGVNQWFRDGEHFYVRTGVSAPEGSPERYPCYIVGYKNSHVRAGVLTSQNLFSPGLPASHERLMTTINRVVSHQGLEFNFVNRSDGDQNLDCDWAVYRGWYDEPQKSYVEADLIDYQLGTLDASSYGFDAVILKGRDDTWGYTFWSPMGWGRTYHFDQYYPTSGIWKEHVISDISLSEDQLVACSAAKIGQMCDERVLTIWTRPDYALKCGDFVRVTISSPPYNGQYDMRILNKSLESGLCADVMELTLYDGFPGEL